MTETCLTYDEMPQEDFDAQYKRVVEATGCRTQAELANILGIGQSSISYAKNGG